MTIREQEGVRGFWRRLRRWLADENISYVYYADATTFQPVEPPDTAAYAILLCTADSLATCRETVAAFPSIIAGGIARGHLGMLAAVARRWVCRISAVPGPRPRLVYGYPFRLDRHSAYLENMETLEGWRGRGIAPLLLSRMVEELRERGVRAVYCCIDIRNTPSMRAVEKCGCTRIGVLISRRRLGRWISQLATLDEASLPQG